MEWVSWGAHHPIIWDRLLGRNLQCPRIPVISRFCGRETSWTDLVGLVTGNFPMIGAGRTSWRGLSSAERSAADRFLSEANWGTSECSPDVVAVVRSQRAHRFTHGGSSSQHSHSQSDVLPTPCSAQTIQVNDDFEKRSRMTSKQGCGAWPPPDGVTSGTTGLVTGE